MCDWNVLLLTNKGVNAFTVSAPNRVQAYNLVMVDPRMNGADRENPIWIEMLEAGVWHKYRPWPVSAERYKRVTDIEDGDGWKHGQDNPDGEGL